MESSEEFMRKEFRWFLSTYKSYKYPVQRVDAMKYFVLRHYGGIYIDMDNVSKEGFTLCVSLLALKLLAIYFTNHVTKTSCSPGLLCEP